MTLIQLLGLIFGVFAMLITYLRHREGKITTWMLLLWTTVWVTVIIGSIDITIISRLGSLMGIGRGLDFVLIVGIIGSFYLIFRVYIRLEDLEREITKVVREVALRSEANENRDSDRVLSKERER